MKHISLILLGWILLSAANAYASESEAIRVAISSEVKEQISKLSPYQKEQLEKAIKVGSKFIPAYFDGSAYDANIEDEAGYKKWKTNIRPLVAGDDGEWASSVTGNVPYSYKNLGKENGTDKLGIYAICPSIDLASVKLTDLNIELSFRVKIIGMMVLLWGKGGFQDIDTSRDNKYYEVVVTLNKNQLVERVSLQDTTTVLLPNNLLKWLNNTITPRQQSSNEKAKGLIHKFANEEAKVCSASAM